MDLETTENGETKSEASSTQARATKDSLNLEELANSIESSVQEAPLGIRSRVMGDCEIPIIRDSHRDLCPQDYTPQIISIGPYHRDLSNGIRACYTNEFSIGSVDFLKMLLSDSAFIYSKLNGFEEPLNEEIEKPRITGLFNNTRDLLLLENQVPFSAIEILNRLFLGVDLEFANLWVRKRIASALNAHLRCRRYVRAFTDSELPTEFDHLLHLCRELFKPLNGVCNANIVSIFQGRDTSVRIRSATEYQNAGVKIKSKTLEEGRANSILDITFSNGTLKIPALVFDRVTISLLKNVVAFEQFGSRYGYYVSAYVEFMCGLVLVEDDVTLLRDRGIIVTIDFDKEVARVIRCLYKHFVAVSGCRCYLDPVYGSLEEYCNRKSVLAYLPGRRG